MEREYNPFCFLRYIQGYRYTNQGKCIILTTYISVPAAVTLSFSFTFPVSRAGFLLFIFFLVSRAASTARFQPREQRTYAAGSVSFASARHR
ncbi:unnamed protein product [Ixodes pacificus]